MRKQIAAANWKMNLTYQQGEKLLDEILKAGFNLQEHQYALFAVPFPYLLMTRSEVEEEYSSHFAAAAQNCHHQKSGAFTAGINSSAPTAYNISPNKMPRL